MILRWALHFASGNSLFSGIAVVLVVWALASFTRFRRYRRLLRLAAFLGVGLIVLSSTPLPWWLYAGWLASFLWWLWATKDLASPVPGSQWSPQITGGVMAGMCLIAAGTDVATLFPAVPRAEHDVMYVIGDSVTAGLNDDDLLWPTILAESNQVQIVNLAQPGAMADSAMKQAERISDGAGGIVLIEIGGNDMLSGRSAAEYAADLSNLLAAVSAPNRTLILMELPLAPFHHEYGGHQRRLAREHGAVLISKREFARVLGLADGTVDGIHLSAQGQQLMADILWKYVGSLYRSTRTDVAAH